MVFITGDKDVLIDGEDVFKVLVIIKGFLVVLFFVSGSVFVVGGVVVEEVILWSIGLVEE